LRALLNGFEQIGAIAIRQAHIEEDEVEIISAEKFGRGAMVPTEDIVAAPAQALLQLLRTINRLRGR